MDKTQLIDLKRKMFLRSALLGIGSLDTLLGITDGISGDAVLLEIIKHALREFENTHPLILEMPVSTGQMGTCYGKNGWLEIKSNFTLFLKCLISESQIILVPTSLPMWRTGDYGGAYSIISYYSSSSSPSPHAYKYFTDYQKPYVFCGDIGLGAGMYDSIYIKGCCARPIVPSFLPDGSFNSADESAAIYWMDVETGGARGNYFMDLCMVHLLDYIRQLKASVSLPNSPVDVLANVDASYQELRSRCDQYQLQSGWYGELLL